MIRKLTNLKLLYENCYGNLKNRNTTGGSDNDKYKRSKSKNKNFQKLEKNRQSSASMHHAQTLIEFFLGLGTIPKVLLLLVL